MDTEPQRFWSEVVSVIRMDDRDGYYALVERHRGKEESLRLKAAATSIEAIALGGSREERERLLRQEKSRWPPEESAVIEKAVVTVFSITKRKEATRSAQGAQVSGRSAGVLGALRNG